MMNLDLIKITSAPKDDEVDEALKGKPVMSTVYFVGGSLDKTKREIPGFDLTPRYAVPVIPTRPATLDFSKPIDPWLPPPVEIQHEQYQLETIRVGHRLYYMYVLSDLPIDDALTRLMESYVEPKRDRKHLPGECTPIHWPQSVINIPSEGQIPVIFLGGPWAGHYCPMCVGDVVPKMEVFAAYGPNERLTGILPMVLEDQTKVIYRFEQFRIANGVFYFYIFDSMIVEDVFGDLLERYIEAVLPVTRAKVGLESKMQITYEDMVAQMGKAIKEGEIRIELCGHLACADNLKGFTLDKTKYRMRFGDETETKLKVFIEPK